MPCRARPARPTMQGMTTDIQITDAAFTRLREILEARGDTSGMLRVEILGGGCSGFQYRFALDNARGDDDTVLERDGMQVVIDPVSLPLLSGSVIDYKDELIGSRFMVENPNARSSCGCGTSFSL